MTLVNDLLQSTGKRSIALAVLVLFSLSSIFFLEHESIISGASFRGTDSTTKERTDITTTLSSCTKFRKYPFPKHHSGLPYLGDVFASHDASVVNFVAINRGPCRHEWRESDAFAATFRQGHRFMCVFDKTVYVLSDYVHATEPHENGFVIRCKIPAQFRHLIQQGQQTTSLHVDLHSIEDLEANRTGLMELFDYESVVITETPSIPNIPVCHPVLETSIHPNQFNLIAFTRIKSRYPLAHYHEEVNATMTSPIFRLEEWIEYHQQQGFDHFIIYDNDDEPHGPIKEMLQSRIESGLVTYRWFPMQDCWVDWGDWKGYLSAEGQVVASLAALHRMGFATRYYAHMDVDEFFVPLTNNKNKTVLETIEEKSAENDAIDVFLWKPTLMAPCNDTTVKAGGSVLRKWQCLTDRHYADVKIIFRANRIMYFFVHYPVLTVNGTEPVEYILDDETEGFLAHYRAEDDQESSWRNTYSGLVRNDFTNKVHFMDAFLATRKEVVAPPSNLTNEDFV